MQLGCDACLCLSAGSRQQTPGSAACLTAPTGPLTDSVVVFVCVALVQTNQHVAQPLNLLGLDQDVAGLALVVRVCVCACVFCYV